MAMPSKSILEKLSDKFIKTNTCWLWTGSTSKGGYGKISMKDDTTIMAHRAMYELLVGPIEDGLTLDHLCRNPSCINPEHLEPVTIQENIARAKNQVTTINKNKEYCNSGHRFSIKNTYRKKDRDNRECRQCRKEATLRFFKNKQGIIA